MSLDTLLFSYGTLNHPNVQIATFGRVLEGEEDAAIGYELQDILINDFDVISKSGKTTHQILVATDKKDSVVSGKLYYVSPQELRHADDYEVEQYGRREITLKSGKKAWVYMAI
ncbi:gamma-glutamylcyclotransferase family protein [Pseudaquidulcibacter saccharophilus]|uniref:gamma-glutamylcyclotransferase family protein n=1 Tax=Pseudaquidulcibacter saccharophilus TaxID=2831900 RepID=UPI001EFF1618|nr:gamma-glutamylcyclotransferase family protein [Pseudaquidulcibacter saccharophilus]